MSTTRQLTNTTSGSFDELLVRSPASGPYQDILTLIGSGGSGSDYDDTQVRADIATNAAAITLRHPAITVRTGHHRPHGRFGHQARRRFWSGRVHKLSRLDRLLRYGVSLVLQRPTD